ncbi:hypothetical protein OBE_04240 [human gut metagenome]|uniref:Uncharacterized protein n=1 Tax=human gut metagenome TaxID=408170 RepID=K1TIY1_9ZZZZ
MRRTYVNTTWQLQDVRPDAVSPKVLLESFLCSDGLPISLSNKYLGDETMRKETANRDPRLKQLILTNDFPTNVTDDLKDSTFVVNEDEFTEWC